MFRITRLVVANYRRFGNFQNQLNFTPKFPKIEMQNIFMISGGIAAFFEKIQEDDAEKQESDLIMTIKRGLLTAAGLNECLK